MAIASALLLLLAACSAQQPAVTIPDDAKVDDLYIVDCLLPGQVRQLGNSTYMTPRRPTRTTAGDCRVRGGEYVAYDRADYKTALKIWLPAAEAGESDAQNTVGEIFEQGLGVDPNFEVAAMWYRRAAEQGHKGAQFNLGTLYETGHGVPQDKVTALNWYRKAWGVSDDELTLRSDSEQALLAQAETNAVLEQELASTRKEVQVARAQASAATAEGRTAEREYQAAQTELAELQKEKESVEIVATKQAVAAPDPISASGKNFGRYYALMIANADYQLLDDLTTPVSDVARVSAVLRDRYGFQIQTVTNGDNASVLRAVNKLNSILEEDDNLLIYYSGHGDKRKSGAYEVGYWLPVNAEPAPDDTFWVPTEQISGHLARLKARRIIVFSDSSFAGLLADNPAFLMATNPASLNSEAYVSLRMPNKSRLLLTSGHNFPLPQTGAADRSVFADALVDILNQNNAILTAPAMYLQLLDALELRRPELSPEFKAIKRAGDEVGDFFFVKQPETQS